MKGMDGLVVSLAHDVEEVFQKHGYKKSTLLHYTGIDFISNLHDASSPCARPLSKQLSKLFSQGFDDDSYIWLCFVHPDLLSICFLFL